jgi:prepilin-type N-terminal cleavage/methylation domain-containing protein
MPPGVPMSPLAMRIIFALRKVAARLRAESGYTLVELLVVMVLLAVVMTPLVTSFASGMVHEVTITRREEAQQNARLALGRMRVDIHCAGGVTSVDQNLYGGFTLTLTEAHEGQEGWCPGVIPSGDTSVGVQWCTKPVSGSTTRFVLYRYLGLDASDCGVAGSTSTFQVDYVTQPSGSWPTNTQTTTAPTSWVGNLWPTGTSCKDGTAPTNGLPSAGVNLSVNIDPVGHPRESYELKDQIALRNANRCP